MPMWDDILGHEQNKEFLARLLQPGNRPHALLFYGPEGIGKKQLALRFAKTFLCQKPDEHPCGRCESCRLINLAEHSFAHPDFILLSCAAQRNAGRYFLRSSGRPHGQRLFRVVDFLFAGRSARCADTAIARAGRAADLHCAGVLSHNTGGAVFTASLAARFI